VESDATQPRQVRSSGQIPGDAGDRGSPADLRAHEADPAPAAALLDMCRGTKPRRTCHEAGTDFCVELPRISGNPFLVKAIRGVMTRLSHVRWLEVLTARSRARAWNRHCLTIDLLHLRAAEDAARDATGDRRGLRARGFAIVGLAA
jgi:DNA-binding GntR family transcriptional regulator